MRRYGNGIICAMSVLAVGLGMMLHESAHVVAGRLAGGAPTLISTTEVLGDFDSLSPGGFVALGASGSVVNVVLCALGWWALRRGSAGAERRLAAWFFFMVNGMLVTTKMLGESVVGIGDWMTILRSFQARGSLRVAVGVAGAAGLVFMVRRSGAALAGLVPAGEPSERRKEALRIVLIGAAASGLLALGGSAAGPVGTTRGLLLGLGAGLGPFVPALFAVRFVSRTPAAGAAPVAAGGWPWYSAAIATTIVMWFVVGPGIAL